MSQTEKSKITKQVKSLIGDIASVVTNNGGSLITSNNASDSLKAESFLKEVGYQTIRYTDMFFAAGM